MKSAAAPSRALAGFVMAALLGGCSSLPFLSHDDAAPGAAAREPEVALYEFEVAAPAPLRTLLLDYLDLARFQKAPKSEGISGPELGRLAAAATTLHRASRSHFEQQVIGVLQVGVRGVAKVRPQQAQCQAHYTGAGRAGTNRMGRRRAIRRRRRDLVAGPARRESRCFAANSVRQFAHLPTRPADRGFPSRRG